MDKKLLIKCIKPLFMSGFFIWLPAAAMYEALVATLRSTSEI
jgi:hypothetical protein